MNHIVSISKRFDFDAAHHLPRVPTGHKCGRLHGHTYVCELILKGRIDSNAGWFVDYADIMTAWLPLHDALDHRLLNDIPGLENPTTENLVKYIWDDITKRPSSYRIANMLECVRVYESATTWCEYRGEV